MCAERDRYASSLVGIRGSRGAAASRGVVRRGRVVGIGSGVALRRLVRCGVPRDCARAKRRWLPYASTRGLLILTRAAALFVLYGVIVYGFFVMEHEHWTRERKGLVAFYACAALAVFLIRDVYYGNEALNHLFGGDQEEAVAHQLDPLREQGWVVIHNLVRDDGGGNVDHFLRGPDWRVHGRDQERPASRCRSGAGNLKRDLGKEALWRTMG